MASRPVTDVLGSPSIQPLEEKLAAQARSVAESILASPVVAPQRGSTTVMSPTMVSVARRGSNDPPAHMLEDLKISDDHSHQPGDSDADTKNVTGEEDSESEQSNLFIGDLSRGCTEEQLHQVFSSYGEVVNIDIKRDKVTKNNLGYGFVQFKSREQAISAKNALDGTEIAMRKVRIGWAQKNTTLFIGDLDGTITTERLREVFSKFGPLVDEETFVKAGFGKYGFVRFQKRADAEKAKMEMSRKVLGSQAIRIGWGDNSLQKHCVHVQFNATLSDCDRLTESVLERFFSQYGHVTSVNLPRFLNSKLKGFAFVHFRDTEEGEKSASKAIAVLADSGKIEDIAIRCSYGKKQVSRNRRQGTNGAGNSNGGGGKAHSQGGGFHRNARGVRGMHLQPQMSPGAAGAGYPQGWVPVAVGSGANQQWLQLSPQQLQQLALQMAQMNLDGSQFCMQQQPLPQPASQPQQGRDSGSRSGSNSPAMYVPQYYPQQVFFGQGGYYGVPVSGSPVQAAAHLSEAEREPIASTGSTIDRQ